PPPCHPSPSTTLSRSGILHNRRGPGPYRFQGTDRDHQRPLLPLQETGGTDGQARGVGKSEVLVEAALERGREMRVTVDQAREQRSEEHTYELQSPDHI